MIWVEALAYFFLLSVSRICVPAQVLGRKCKSLYITYTKCLGGTSFHPGPPSFRALTRSTSSAWWSSTTKSTSWLLSDLPELEEDEDCCLSKLLMIGFLDFELDGSPLLESLRCLPLSTDSRMS